MWYLMTDRDVLALGPVHAVEIYNAGCHDDNDSADSTYMLDLVLEQGMRVTACATDDAHFVPNTHDRAAGWVMVKSEALEPDALLGALKSGHYYSSTGPVIHDMQVEPGNKLTIHCSPAERVFLIGARAKYQAVGGQGVTEAEFDLSNWPSPWARVVVRDAAGKKAWTNPVWLNEG
jgi:hypothetical protein